MNDASAQFGGAKILLHCEGALVTYLRDNKPDIPFPGLWDLPGGGREGSETPQECALRETEEEFALRISATRISWSRAYPSQLIPNQLNWFFVAAITETETRSVIFGDEGQHWEMMPIDTFLTHPNAVPHLQAQIRDVPEF